LAIAGVIGTIAVAVAGRLVLAIGIGLIAAFAASSRRWFLRQMDARLSDRDAGDAVRRLHWDGIAEQCDPACRYRGQHSFIAVTPT
jgi:hypothetical protein